MAHLVLIMALCTIVLTTTYDLGSYFGARSRLVLTAVFRFEAWSQPLALAATTASLFLT